MESAAQILIKPGCVYVRVNSVSHVKAHGQKKKRNLCGNFVLNVKCLPAKGRKRVL